MRQVEKAVCSRNDWGLEEYYTEVKRREDAEDPYCFVFRKEDNLIYREITNALAKIDELMKKASVGEKPVVQFKMAPELTKPVTLILYKWILLSHIYLYHQAFQEKLKTQPEESTESIQEILQDVLVRKETEKIQRRYYEELSNKIGMI